MYFTIEPVPNRGWQWCVRDKTPLDINSILANGVVHSVVRDSIADLLQWVIERDNIVAGK